MEHYLASDGDMINANVVYFKIDNIIVGSFLGYEGHNDVSDSLFMIKNNKVKLSINIFDFPKLFHKNIKKIEIFRIKFENKRDLGKLSLLGKKLAKSDDTQIYDTHWEYGTENFNQKILKKLSKVWSLSIKW